MVKIILICLATGLALGLAGGLLQTYAGVTIPGGGAYIGAGVGVVGAILLSRRKNP